MDIPGKDTDVNINISGETQNLSATERAVNSLRNAIANLGRSADSADDEVDDLEDEMQEAGAAGFEGAAGVTAFATASEVAEEAVDDLEDELDDVDFDLGLDEADVDVGDVSSLRSLVDNAEDATDALDDVKESADAADDAVDGIEQLDFGDFGDPRTRRRTIGDILPDDIDERVDDESLLGIDPDALAETTESIQSKFPSAFRVDDPDPRPTRDLSLADFGFDVPEPGVRTEQASLFDSLFDQISGTQETLDDFITESAEDFEQLEDDIDLAEAGGLASKVAVPKIVGEAEERGGRESGARKEKFRRAIARTSIHPRLTEGIIELLGKMSPDEMARKSDDLELLGEILGPGEVAEMQRSLLRSGRASDFFDAETGDFTVNQDPLRRRRRFNEIATDLTQLARLSTLMGSDDISPGMIQTALDESSMAPIGPGDIDSILRGRGQEGSLFDQDMFQTVLEETLKREGDLSASGITQTIDDLFEEEQELTEKRREYIRKVTDLFDQDDKIVSRAFRKLDRDNLGANMAEVKRAMRASPEFDDDDVKSVGAHTSDFSEFFGRDVAVDNALNRLHEAQSEKFRQLIEQIEDTSVDDPVDAQMAFMKLLTNDVDEIDPEDVMLGSSEKRGLKEGFGDTAKALDLVEEELLEPVLALGAGDADEGVFEDRAEARFMLSHFFTDALVDNDGLTTNLKGLTSQNAITERVDDLFTAEDAPDMEGVGLEDFQIKKLEDKLINFKKTMENEGFLTGGDRDDSFEDLLVNADAGGGFAMPAFRKRMEERFIEDVPDLGSEADLRRKQKLAEAIDVMTRDEMIQEVVRDAVENEEALTKASFLRSVDRLDATKNDAERMKAFVDEMGDVLFDGTGVDVPERRPVGGETDIVEIDKMNDEMFDMGAPAKREPLNRAVRNLREQELPLARETIVADLLQQEADTDSEEFRRLIEDVRAQIRKNRISFTSLFEFEGTQETLDENLRAAFRDTDLDDRQIRLLTGKIRDQITRVMADTETEVESIQDFFDNKDAMNLRDVLLLDREEIEAYGSNWEDVIEKTEDGVKETQETFRNKAAPDTAALERAQTLLSNTSEQIEEINETRVTDPITGDQLTRIDVRGKRAIRNALMGDIPEADDMNLPFRAVLRDVSRLGDRFIETDRDAMRFGSSLGTVGSALRRLRPKLGITSANLGPLNVSLRNFGAVISGLITILGPLLTLIGGLVTGFVALAGAIGSVTAVGALGFFEQLESQFGGINNRMEAMEATFNAVRELGREAISPLENTTLAGMAPSEFFQRTIQRSIELLNHFARVFAEIAEMDAVTNAIERISAALFEPNREGDGATMLEAMRVATKKLVPIVADLTVFLIDNLPEFIIFMSQVSDVIAGPVGSALVDMIDLMGSLIKVGSGFVFVYSHVVHLVLELVNAIELLGDMLSVIPGINNDRLLFGIGATAGLALGLQAAVSLFKRLAGAITVVLNLYGKFLKMITRSGGKLNRVGRFLANIGKGGSAAGKAASQTRLGRFGGGAKAGGLLARIRQSSAVSKILSKLPSLGGKGRGLLTLGKLLGLGKLGGVFKKITGVLRGLKIAKLGRLGKILAPVLKISRLFVRFLPIIGWLAWLPEIYKALKFVRDFLQRRDRQMSAEEKLDNRAPFLGPSEEKKAAQALRAGNDERVNQIIANNSPQAVPDGRAGFNGIQIVVDGDGKDEEEIANKTARLVSSRNRILDRHNGRRPGPTTL